VSPRTGAAWALGLAAGLHLVPSVATIPTLHRRLLPRLSGSSARPHVALTFDDGPDPASTPAFLDALGELGGHATFFVLGGRLEACPELGRRIVAEGHELAVHGWQHRPHLLRAPWSVHADVGRTVDCIERVCAVTPRFWRPPNGVLSGAGLLAAAAFGLTPVLWTADGRDWQAGATAESVRQRVCRRLDAGGVVLLHDSDVTSARGSWHAALGALPGILDSCRAAGWMVGPLRDHGLVTTAGRSPAT
jgi:peptidoglycan/xylan/chitin deacetylase (PgdA/CDA1 family)